jgi:hypothetical protein
MSNDNNNGSGKNNGEELTPAAKAYLEIMKKQSEAAAAGQGSRVVTLGDAGGAPAEHRFWNTQV